MTYIKEEKYHAAAGQNCFSVGIYSNPKLVVNVRQRKRGFGGAAPDKKSLPTSQIR